MNVSLTPELEALIQEKVRSGLYGSASEVVRDGLRLLHQRDELRKEIAIGLEQADRGQTARLDVDAIKAQGRKRRKSAR